MKPDKQKSLHAILQRNELGCLLFFRPDELVLTTGYLPHHGLSFLVCTADGDCTLYVPGCEPAERLPANIAINTFPWGNFTIADPWPFLFDSIAGLLKAKGLHTKPVSFIQNSNANSPAKMSAESAALPAGLLASLANVSEAGLKSIDGELKALYQYKTAGNVAGIKLTHKAASVASSTFFAMLRNDVSEAAIAGTIEAAVTSLLDEEEIFYAKAWPCIQSGANAIFAGTYSNTTGKKLRDGELVVLEMSVCVNGYWADITRTGQVGMLTQKNSELFSIIKTAQNLAMKAIKPGVSMKEVDTIARDYITGKGYGHLFAHALGHQVGFRYHDPGDVLSPYSNGVIEEGMVLTVEPGIYGREINGGIRIEDNVLVTSSGYEILSAYP